MKVLFPEALDRLRSPGCGVGAYDFGPASCFDEEAYERLGVMFDEAVAAFTACEGTPLQPTPTFPDKHVERAACWRRGDRMLYAVLSWEDNTRYRLLTLGLARRGTVVAGCWSRRAKPDPS